MPREQVNEKAMANDSVASVRATKHWGKHDHTVLVLQGGGALGAYQAGAFEELATAGIQPNWIAGVSIGAINSALIAGNPPERRVERLKEFWDRATRGAPFVPPSGLDALRPWLNGLSFAGTATFGIPGFFAPRPVPPFLAPEGTPAALSFYSTEPLKATLEELADFDLINSKRVRLSLGAVNVRTGESVYFDNHRTTIVPEHVMASGALPPGFPPVTIDGEMYLDGGIASNSPLAYVLEQDFRLGALIFQVDVFSGAGELPQNLQQVQERAKDIQYASKRRLNVDRIQDLERLRATLHRVLDKLPKSLQADPDVQALAKVATRGRLTLVHVINRCASSSPEFKDGDFSRATVGELWQAGRDDVRRTLAQSETVRTTNIGEKFELVELAH
ncbi:MAG: patatin-like phospholipase family protein [Burkholderiales bacterium]